MQDAEKQNSRHLQIDAETGPPATDITRAKGLITPVTSLQSDDGRSKQDGQSSDQ